VQIKAQTHESQFEEKKRPPVGESMEERKSQEGRKEERKERENFNPNEVKKEKVK
jgi:hypothetical protein